MATCAGRLSTPLQPGSRRRHADTWSYWTASSEQRQGYYRLPSIGPGGAADGGDRLTNGPDQARCAGSADTVFGEVAATGRPAPTDRGRGPAPPTELFHLLPAPGSRMPKYCAMIT